MRGPAPKPEGEKRRANADTFAWRDVVDTPFVGWRPQLPDDCSAHPAVTQWWQAVSTMPHCVLWEPSDWVFALACLPLVAEVYCGQGRVSAFAELRQREAILGTTYESRLKLRIRYVAEEPEVAAPKSGRYSHLRPA